MAYGGKVTGPGGATKSAKSTGCKSMGPGGTSPDTSVTMSRGYDSKRTQGLRNEYQVTGRAENGKASK